MCGTAVPHIVFRAGNVLFYLRIFFSEDRLEKKGQGLKFNSDHDHYGGDNCSHRRTGR